MRESSSLLVINPRLNRIGRPEHHKRIGSIGLRDRVKASGRKGSPGKSKAGARSKTRRAKPSHVLVKQGDIAPRLTAEGVRSFVVEQATKGKQEAAVSAIEAIRHGPPELAANSEPIKAILAGAAPDDAALLRFTLQQPDKAEADAGSSPASGGLGAGVPRRDRSQRHTSDELADGWRRGGYPYKFKMLRRDYENQKFILQTE
jgi:hypothetical protein